MVKELLAIFPLFEALGIETHQECEVVDLGVETVKEPATVAVAMTVMLKAVEAVKAMEMELKKKHET
jgi:hypothetical protein